MPNQVELSPFQKEKLLYYFKFLEPDQNSILDSGSLNRLMKKIYKFTGWSADDPRGVRCLELHQAFFEILFEKAEEEGGEKGCASLTKWYAIWSHILPGIKGMTGFPVWLRLMPKLLFLMIDRDGDDVISGSELASFYRDVLAPQHSKEELDRLSVEAYDQMTDYGRYPLDHKGFEQIFANFLIGRTPHGPGKYIFGCFKHEDVPFTLIQPPSD